MAPGTDIRDAAPGRGRDAAGRRGLFLSFEGIEGSGKSTQASRLAGWLREQGREVVPVREPGGTPLGEDIRAALLAHRPGGMVPWCELCLYMASRAQLVHEVIRPACERGAVVIADRFAESSMAYQGGGRGLGVRPVRALYDQVAGGLRPDPVFLLDLEPSEGIRRIVAARGLSRLDRLESEPLDFHRRVRAAYRRMARREPDRFVMMDAADEPAAIQDRIRSHLGPLLGTVRRT